MIFHLLALWCNTLVQLEELMATNCPQRMVKVGREYTMEETSSWDVEGVDPSGSRSTPREKRTYPTFWKRKIIDSKVPWEGICLLLRKKGIQSLFQIKWRLIFIRRKKKRTSRKTEFNSVSSRHYQTPNYLVVSTSKWIISPGMGVKISNIWVATT